MILDDKINILLMPTDLCNMNCAYCFNRSNTGNNGKMNVKTLNRIYEIVFKQCSDVTIVWHGGEPMKMGVEFFSEALKMQEKYNNVKIKNRMQTNLTLLDDGWIEFFKTYRVGLGSSYDGIKNDVTRGCSDIIMANSALLERNGLKHSFIMVVSKYNVNALIDSYIFYKKHNKNFTINMYLPTGESNDIALKLEPKSTIDKLNEFFDFWLYDADTNICVGYFDRFVKFILLHKKNVCTFTSCLGKWIGIRYNGEIVPCNRYFPQEYSYGNVWDYENIGEAFESKGFRRILSEAIKRREKCKTCLAFDMCTGGCNNVALMEKGISENGGDSCKIMIGVYEHIDEKLNELKVQVEDEKINPYVREALKKYRELVLGI